MAVSKRGSICDYEFELGARHYRRSTKRTNRQNALKVEASKRTRLLNALQVALDTGARLMELLALHKNDVQLTEGYVSLL